MNLSARIVRRVVTIQVGGMDKADLAGFRLSTLKSDIESGQISLIHGTREWGRGQLPSTFKLD